MISIFPLGPTSCGKTVFTSKFIKHVNQLVKPTIQEIIFCYAIWQPEYTKMQIQNERIKFIKGLPDFEQLSLGVRRLVVIDDMISELNSQIETMFIRGSHHLSISLMLICQNVFSRVKMFSQTLSFFGQKHQNSEKMTESKNFGQKFFGQNRFRMFQNVFST